jgi:CRISPR system Cascade subunit CasE
VLYLSKLDLNPHSRAALHDFGDPDETHRTLCTALGGRRVDLGLLHRAETSSQGEYILAQSIQAPDWSRLPRAYTIEPPGIKAFNPRIPQGAICHFRLRANPNRKSSEDGRRRGLDDGNEQVSWLERQASRSGFRVLQVVPHSQEMIPIRGIRCLAVTFDGILLVEEEELCLGAVTAGIGREKAFGMGLLSLRQVG